MVPGCTTASLFATVPSLVIYLTNAAEEPSENRIKATARPKECAFPRKNCELSDDQQQTLGGLRNARGRRMNHATSCPWQSGARDDEYLGYAENSGSGSG